MKEDFRFENMVTLTFINVVFSFNYLITNHKKKGVVH